MGGARHDQRGERYTHGHHASVLASHQWRTVANSATYFAPSVQETDLILDLGCGPGTLTVDLARVTGATVIGVDNARAAIAAAEHEAASHAAVSLMVASAYELPFPKNTFDICHAHQVLQHTVDPQCVLTEFHRVLRPGGRVAVRDCTYSSFTWSPAASDLDDWLTSYIEVARINSGEPDAGDFLADWVATANFTVLAVTKSNWVFDDTATCRWWGGLWAKRIVESAFGQQLEELGRASSDERLSMAQAFLNWSTAPGAWFCVPSTEVLAEKR